MVLFDSSTTGLDDDSRSAKGIILADCVTKETAAAALTGYNIQSSVSL